MAEDGGGNDKLLVHEAWGGMDTRGTRASIPDDKCFWLDGVMPYAPRRARIMPDLGTPIYTTDGPAIAFFKMCNLVQASYAIVVRADGSVVAVNIDGSGVSIILPAGSLALPTQANVGISQWGNQYVLIVGVIVDEYYIWDGAVVYTAGSLAPGVLITNVGSGYTSVPTVSITGGPAGGGGGASIVALVSGGVVTGASIVSSGHGWTAGETPTLTFTGGGGTMAAGTVDLMQIGTVFGSAIETYSGSVWITGGTRRISSAPGSVWDFSAADGGTAVVASDSTIKVTYAGMINTNAFLYLVGDTSINYISGVQTVGSPPVTTYTYQNADTEVGTYWPNAILSWSSSFVIANPWGVHLLNGSRMVKISEPLDGIYSSDAAGFALLPSLAKATVFDTKILVLLLPIIDPLSGVATNKLFCWDGKRWWAASQGRDLIFITTLSFQANGAPSAHTAYGTDGTSIYALFQTPSGTTLKVVQTKLWDTPNGYTFAKANSRFWGLFKFNSIASTGLTISVDSEANADPYVVPMSTYAIAGPAALGYFATPPQAIGQQGVLTGLTLQTQAADADIISLAINADDVGYRG